MPTQSRSWIPSLAAAPATAPDDPRVGHLLGGALADGGAPRVVIAGFPCDEGVRRNGGRSGAATAPLAIRRALYRLTPHAAHADAFTQLLARTYDAGDLVLTGDLDTDQAHLGDALAPHIRAGAFVIVLGGGHETACGHFLAYARAEQDVAILNWDAHADVRELRGGQAHSGSPFRQALEHASGRCRSYTVAGLQPHSVAQAHLSFVRAHGAAHWAHEVDAALIARLYAASETAHGVPRDSPHDAPLLASFDLDAVDRAWAPGVSAPATNGLSVSHWLRAAHQAGRSTRVRSADVVELNPRVDVDEQTVALAALTVWWLLAGLAERVPLGDDAGD